jgi:hypothetical protein
MNFNTTLQNSETLHKWGVFSFTHVASTRMFIAKTNKSFLQACTALELAVKNSSHSNKALIHDYKKYGANAFVFEILDVMPPNLSAAFSAQKRATHPLYLYNTPHYKTRANLIIS